MRVTITQDKLVDILMHAATREDISTLRNEVNLSIDSLRKDIDRLDSRIDKLDNRIDKLDNRIHSNFKWLMSTVVLAILVPIAFKVYPHSHTINFPAASSGVSIGQIF